MACIRLLTSVFLSSSLMSSALHAQDLLTSCHPGWESWNPGESQRFSQHIPGELELWVEWRINAHQYVISLSRENGNAWITMIDDFKPYWDPELLPLENRDAAIEQRPEPRTDLDKSAVSEALAKELSLAWSEWLSEPPGEAQLGKDGVTYRFRKIDQCREAWSPDPGTLNDMRVTLVEMLHRLAGGNGSHRPMNMEQRVGDWLQRIRIEP